MSMINQTFKKGDQVFHSAYGWGKVMDIDYDYNPELPIEVEFLNWDCELFTEDGRTAPGMPLVLSFTEYTYEGFSLERREELPNEGEIVWVRNEFPGNWAIGHFYKKIGDYYYVSDYVGQKEWSKRGLEITTKNPYDKSNI